MIWKGIKIISGFATFFAVCYILATMGEWIEAWTNRHDRKLRSFTLFFPGVMTTEKLKELLNDVNSALKGTKYDGVDQIDLRNVVSITTLPSDDGNQFTVWYKDKPPKPKRAWSYDYNNSYYQNQKRKGIY